MVIACGIFRRTRFAGNRHAIDCRRRTRAAGNNPNHHILDGCRFLRRTDFRQLFGNGVFCFRPIRINHMIYDIWLHHHPVIRKRRGKHCHIQGRNSRSALPDCRFHQFAFRSTLRQINAVSACFQFKAAVCIHADLPHGLRQLARTDFIRQCRKIAVA